MAKRYRVMTPTERDGKTYWDKLGMVFEGKNGSLSGTLACLPVNGKIVLFEDDGSGKPGGGPGGGNGGARSAAPPADDDTPF